MVEHAVQPSSPLVAPPDVEEEDEVEEIEREESRPQAIRILYKLGDEVVVMEEEDSTREVRRLESTLSTAMKQIKQLIKRMEPLAEENAKLKEVVKLMEKNIQRAQHERDLAESNAKDLEYQKGILFEQLATVFEQLMSVSDQLEQQDMELNQLHQVVGQLQEEEKKVPRRVEKLMEVLKGAQKAMSARSMASEL
ncbi:uncharacterized protein [Miscanthus floridulus]|uniref:uncharacterized protein n=1 Tax=Miscanthus floridulus TaxID=154761 RepID=UPI0034575F87